MATPFGEAVLGWGRRASRSAASLTHAPRRGGREAESGQEKSAGMVGWGGWRARRRAGGRQGDKETRRQGDRDEWIRSLLVSLVCRTAYWPIGPMPGMPGIPGAQGG